MTHEYHLALGGTIAGEAAVPASHADRLADPGPPTAVAWAADAILAIGSDPAVRSISRGDSTFLALDGALVTGAHGAERLGEHELARLPPLVVGGPSDLAIWRPVTDGPRAGAGWFERIATVRGGRLDPGDALRELPRAPRPAEVLEARDRLAGIAIRTPLRPSIALSARLGADVRLKLESAQPTGSFKIRGAHNRVLALAEARRGGDARRGGAAGARRGAGATAGSRAGAGSGWAGVVGLPLRIITASSGNHGINVAAAAARAGLEATILVPRSISPAKRAALAAHGSDAIRVELVEGSTDAAEAQAAVRAARGEGVYVSPYDDTLVLAGQATVGLEILEEWPACESIVVPTGGGGLISGIATWVAARRPEVAVVGVQPAASDAMHHYLATGSLDGACDDPTLADGVAGGIARDAVTLAICRTLVDEVLVVDEEAIREAMRWAVREEGLTLEPSAVLGIAALLRGALPSGRSAAIVVSGGNVTPETVAAILADDDGASRGTESA